MRPARFAGAALLLAVGAGAARAQRAAGLRAGPERVDAQAAEPNPDQMSVNQSALATIVAPRAFPSIPHPGLPRRDFAPVVSLILPGGGQLMQGNDRFLVYAAVEGLAWWTYSKEARERAQQENAFRDIARRVARSHFSPTGPDGDWNYYEKMRDKSESGVYLALNDSGFLRPDPDTSTYNGQLWFKQQNIHERSPAGVAAAMAAYEKDAIRPEFRWSWVNAGFQWDIFQRSTGRRNDANTGANWMLGLIAVNHLISMIDAFATYRLEVHPGPNGGAAASASVRW